MDSVEVAELADRVLVSGLVEGRHLLRVYSGAGRVMGEIEMPSEPARHVDLAATGDAVLVVEGDVGQPGRAVRLYDFSKKSWERQVLPNDEVVGWAAAFDRQTVVSWGEWGEGALRLHRFGAGERASDTRRGWSRSFEDRPYYPVDQAAEAGLILATDGRGVYEVLNADGEILWRLEPKQETRRIAGWLGVSEADAEGAVRHLRVGLVGDGSITLSDSERGLTHLLRWSGDGRYQDEPVVLTLNTESTSLDSSGQYIVERDADAVRYGPLEDWQ